MADSYPVYQLHPILHIALIDIQDLPPFYTSSIRPIMSSLLDLTVELLDRIVTLVEKPTSLTSLNHTCKLLEELTEGPLYESVLIINNKATSFATAISNKPTRKARVKDVVVDSNIKKSAD